MRLRDRSGEMFNFQPATPSGILDKFADIDPDGDRVKLGVDNFAPIGFLVGAYNTKSNVPLKPATYLP